MLKDYIGTICVWCKKGRLILKPNGCVTCSYCKIHGDVEYTDEAAERFCREALEEEQG